MVHDGFFELGLRPTAGFPSIPGIDKQFRDGFISFILILHYKIPSCKITAFLLTLACAFFAFIGVYLTIFDNPILEEYNFEPDKNSFLVPQLFEFLLIDVIYQADILNPV